MNEFTILIPAYNESQIISTCIKSIIIKLYKHHVTKFEILIIENGSTDNSMEIIKSLQKIHKNLRVIHLDKANFGQALRTGILQAKYKKIILFNADWWDINFLKQSLTLLDKYPIVVGSKTINPDSDRRPLIRKFGSRLLTQSLTWLFKYSGTDSHGLKAFRKKELLSILPSIVTHEIIESEILIRAKNLNWPIKELPVSISEIRPARVGFLKRCFRVLRELIYLKTKLKPVFERKLHADDAGYNLESINSINALLDQNKLASFSVLVNNKYLSQVIKLINKYPRVPVFLHINLVEGEPVTSSAKISSLVNKQSRFMGKYKFIRQLITGNIQPEDIKTEILSQLHKLHKNRVKLQGIDSHQHLHALSPIAEIVEQVAKKNNIKYIRSYSQMQAQTIVGFIKIICLKFLGILSHLRYYQKYDQPVSWKKKSWLDFYICSWEKINPHKIKNHQILVIHPGLGYDKS